MRHTLIVLKNRLVNKSFVDVRLKEIADFEQLSLADRADIQKQKLQKILAHAANHTPFYAELLGDLHISKDVKINPGFFRKIPIIEKDDIRSNFQKLTSDDLRQRLWFKNHTGGSTGEPVEFIQDRYFDDCSIATAQLEFQWAGKGNKDTHVKLWGSQEDILQGGLSMKSKLGNWFSKRVLLNCFLMSPGQMGKYAQIIQTKRSVFIEAYADSAYEISRYINKNGIILHNITGMVTSAGTLHPFMREEIETAFGCCVTNRYGSREMGNIACEREPGCGLDVSMFTHLVEVLDEQGEPCQPGQEGELIVTSLTNYSMPLIRYRIGDRAIVKNYLEDGFRTCTQLENVTGRSIEVFRKKDGSVISSVFFMHFLGVVNYRNWLDKFQIIQLNYDEIVMKIVVSRTPSQDDLLSIETDIKRVMGADCQVKIEIVAEIPKLPSGKYQYTQCLVEAR